MVKSLWYSFLSVKEGPSASPATQVPLWVLALIIHQRKKDTVSLADLRILWKGPEPGEHNVRIRTQDYSVAVTQMLPLCCQYLPGGLVKKLIGEATQEAHLHESPVNCLLAYFANKDLPKIPNP